MTLTNSNLQESDPFILVLVDADGMLVSTLALAFLHSPVFDAWLYVEVSKAGHDSPLSTPWLVREVFWLCLLDCREYSAISQLLAT